MALDLGLGIRQVIGVFAAAGGGAGFLQAAGEAVGDRFVGGAESPDRSAILEVARSRGHIGVVKAVIGEKLLDTVIPQGNAIALVLLLVEIRVIQTRLAVGAAVIHPAVAVGQRRGQFGAKTGHARQVQVAGGAPAVEIPDTRGLLETQLAGGLGAYEVDRTGRAVATVQGALRAAQDLHPLKFRQVSQQAAGASGVNAVVIQAHGGVLGDHHRIGVADTPDKQGHVVAGGGVGRHLQTGRGHTDVLGIDQSHGLDRFGVVGVNGYRNILQ